MSTPVKVGDPVRLLLQMEDGEASFPLVVKATLRNEAGALLTEVALTHIGLGLFRNSSYFLTTEKEIVATYRIYNADGVNLNPDFTFDAERFYRDEGTTVNNGGGSTVIIGNEFIVEVETDDTPGGENPGVIEHEFVVEVESV